VSHILLYLLMFLLPISGWLINSAANIPFKVFWLFPLPDLVQKNKELKELAETLHLALVIGLVLILMVHVGAALRHHFIRKNNVLRGMLLGRRTDK
jgi:cytochrome b561